MPQYLKDESVQAVRYPDSTPGEIAQDFADAFDDTEFSIENSSGPGGRMVTVRSSSTSGKVRSEVSFQANESWWVIYDGETLSTLDDAAFAAMYRTP